METYNRAIWLEENNALWWFLEMMYAEDSARPKMVSETTAFVLAEHLSKMISHLPGPLWARALLYTVVEHRTKRRDQHVTVHEFVELLPADRKAEWVTDVSKAGVIDLCPLASSANATMNGTRVPAWFGSSLPIMVIPLADLAYQVYTECLLAQAISL